MYKYELLLITGTYHTIYSICEIDFNHRVRKVVTVRRHNNLRSNLNLDHVVFADEWGDGWKYVEKDGDWFQNK